MTEERWKALVALARNPEAEIHFRFQAYEELLKAMDWAYEYSDNHRVWSREIDHLIDIREIRADLYDQDPEDQGKEKKRAFEMYDKYCPWEKGLYGWKVTK